ncbi:MAG: hemin uptake protein HemP [Pacificibacter sp.]|uniref:hemin uptake protein HemP n=1 Tax=Pacificibacter sp. TaxID=1917866 RepID=UPI00321B1FFF
MPLNSPRESSPQAEAKPTYDAIELTKGGTLANIVLDDQTYTLRITRAGKLILTK